MPSSYEWHTRRHPDSHYQRISALKVISRAPPSWNGSIATQLKYLQTIGEELGVATVLEGGVQRVRRSDSSQRTAHRLRQRMNTSGPIPMIGELTAANIFAIQTEIAKTAIADALRATLSPEEQELLDTVPTENMAALEAYFRGKQHMAKRTSAALAEAVDDFNRAIELDPNFALAYVGLADSYMLQIDYSGLPLGRDACESASRDRQGHWRWTTDSPRPTPHSGSYRIHYRMTTKLPRQRSNVPWS